MKMLIPIVMLLVGTGAGVGAGIFLRPAAPDHPEVTEESHADEPTAEPATESASEDSLSAVGKEYVKLSNQFVVPIVRDKRVAAMVVMTLSIEVAQGNGQLVYDTEPKLRDEFLSVLFDHAAIGGFEGQFTNTNNLDVIRRNLSQKAKAVLGEGVAYDVLIFEIARQDY